MQRIKRGDKVRIISGKHRGVDGTVLRVDLEKNGVFIENINKVKKHQKANQKNKESKIIEKEAIIPLSNVALVDVKNKNVTTKVKFSLNKSGKKIRVARKSGNEINFKK